MAKTVSCQRVRSYEEFTVSKSRIAIVFGSDSDWPVMEKCVARLRASGLDGASTNRPNVVISANQKRR